jgi:DedD protein
MGLLDLFNRNRAGATPASALASGEHAEQARTRAKRRLIGAVVLLGMGVIAFPLLFETQPRPIPVDIPIQIPSRDSAVPLALPAPKASAVQVQAAPRTATPAPASSESKLEAPRDATPVAAAAPASVAKASTPKAEPAARPATPVAASTPASAIQAAGKPAPEASGRFVVQVGAFADASAVRDARARVEKLGLVTYTQVVETSSGPRTRVRVGPFVSRDEADQVAAKLKAAGLPGAVLTL